MSETIDIVYVIPFYDKDVEAAIDTIESIIFFADHSYLIVAVDDCSESCNSLRIADHFKDRGTIRFFKPEVDFFSAKANTYGLLFVKLLQAYKYISADYPFRYLVKLDTDALIVKGGLFEEIEARRCNRRGMLGSYKIKADGTPRSFRNWIFGILAECCRINKGFSYVSFWIRCVAHCTGNRKLIGSHVLGGMYVITQQCLSAMEEFLQPMKPEKLVCSFIGEDVIFCLLALSAGFDLHDFGRPGEPLCLGHKNLPLALDEIIKGRAIGIHSVRKGVSGESESEIRAIFQAVRCPPRQERAPGHDEVHIKTA